MLALLPFSPKHSTWILGDDRCMCVRECVRYAYRGRSWVLSKAPHRPTDSWLSSRCDKMAVRSVKPGNYLASRANEHASCIGPQSTTNDMPTKPTPRCSWARCPHRRPCPVHSTPRPRDTRTDAERNRGTKAERGYTNAYRRERDALLSSHPLCAWGCGRPATSADHVPALSAYDDRSQWSGTLIPACSKCNGGMVGQD